MWHRQQGNLDEAFWLIFLFVHFGKHKIGSWRLIQNVYGQLHSNQLWNWETIKLNPEAFRIWLAHNKIRLQETSCGFGNHRKYETLDAYHPLGTAAVFQSYIEWVNEHQSHSQMMADAKEVVGNDPKKLFNYLYKSMSSVVRFGRTAKFDYLTMVGKLELEIIEPNSAYLNEATGPKRGANLLFGGSTHAGIPLKKLEANLKELNDHLQLYFGWQVLEDSLCNWQKSPDQYVYFKG